MFGQAVELSGYLNRLYRYVQINKCTVIYNKEPRHAKQPAVSRHVYNIRFVFFFLDYYKLIRSFHQARNPLILKRLWAVRKTNI